MDYHFMTDFYGDENTSDDDVELTISDPVVTDGRVQVLVKFHRHSSRTGHDDYMECLVPDGKIRNRRGFSDKEAEYYEETLSRIQKVIIECAYDFHNGLM